MAAQWRQKKIVKHIFNHFKTAKLNTVLQNAVSKLTIFVDIQFDRNNANMCSKVLHLLKLVKKQSMITLSETPRLIVQFGHVSMLHHQWGKMDHLSCFLTQNDHKRFVSFQFE